jgi:hypothetical protein
MKKVLFVNSSSSLYGVDKSLLELLTVPDKARYMPIVPLPEDGPLARELGKYDINGTCQ